MLRTLTILVWGLVAFLFVGALPDLLVLDWAQMLSQDSIDAFAQTRMGQGLGAIAVGVTLFFISLHFLRGSTPDVGSILTLGLVFGLPIAFFLQVMFTNGMSPGLDLMLLGLIGGQGLALLVHGITAFSSKETLVAPA